MNDIDTRPAWGMLHAQMAEEHDKAVLRLAAVMARAIMNPDEKDESRLLASSLMDLTDVLLAERELTTMVDGMNDKMGTMELEMQIKQFIKDGIPEAYKRAEVTAYPMPSVEELEGARDRSIQSFLRRVEPVFGEEVLWDEIREVAVNNNPHVPASSRISIRARNRLTIFVCAREDQGPCMVLLGEVMKLNSLIPRGEPRGPELDGIVADTIRRIDEDAQTARDLGVPEAAEALERGKEKIQEKLDLFAENNKGW